ncbi:glutamate ligase domain-containing protein [Flavobacterium sp. 25HG05S-40]|uniref:glutamate ligase domain-containing protein n=1 Tax=Flavobacterium sp. 25HG05S-40 TaxID=3458682 RepID=UPI0040445B53
METARGGLLRSGLCFDHCDVGIITNIKEDHLGLNDIETLRDLACVKAVVARSVKETGWTILNAEDENCVRIARELDCNRAFFAMDEHNEIVQKRIRNNRPVAVLENDYITIIKGEERIRIAHVNTIPLTENGTCRFMIANILAASLASYCYGFEQLWIQNALQSFYPSYEQTPSRMNLFEFNNFKVLVDYAHNPHGFLAMKDYLSNVKAPRKIGIIAGIGDRRDEDTLELAKIAASMFDHIIVRQEHSLRGRNVDEINNLVIEGIRSVNKMIPIDLMPLETEAIQHALGMAQLGDFIVALSDEHKKVVDIINAKLEMETPVMALKMEIKPLAC